MQSGGSGQEAIQWRSGYWLPQIYSGNARRNLHEKNKLLIKFFLKQIINNDENYAHDTTKKVLGEKGTNIFFLNFV